ncbi:hypothetical protein ANO14919_056570 [Xylariales sp. No.14919]|nr:hypothetical protein ANO14919_056570 [Xylariales sp. No.14919]
MSPQRPRQQRRSACNRCRTYKLRCERDPQQPDRSCERCRKSGAECIPATATTAIAAGSSSGSSPGCVRVGSGPVSADSDSGNSTQPISRLAPASLPLQGGPEEAIGLGSRELPMSMQARQERQSTGRPTQARSEDASACFQAGMMGLSSPALARSPPPSFDTSYFIVPDGRQDARRGPGEPNNVNRRESFIDSVFNGSYMDLLSPSADPLLQELGLENSTPKQLAHEWRGSLGASLSPTEVASFDDSCVDLVSLQGHNDNNGNVAHNYLCDVLELSRRLAEDHESLQTADVYPPYADNVPNPVETAVQRAVDHSSHFCELLKGIIRGSSATTTSTPLSCTPGPGRQSSKTKGPCCVVLTTSLVTAYILLVRNWRRIFIHLHRLLLASSPGEKNSGGLGIIPNLQLGGFRVESSPATQVAILIELSFDMLGQIETGLGAGSWGVSGACKGGQQYRLGQVVEGPVAASIREMLLTQEMVCMGEGAEELDTLSLVDLAGQLKSRLRD